MTADFLALVSCPDRAASVALFVAKRARFVANAFTFPVTAFFSLSFVVISCVVWPARCGAGHIFFAPRTGNPLLA